MISAKPANAATINVGTVLRVFVVPYRWENSMLKRFALKQDRVHAIPRPRSKQS